MKGEGFAANVDTTPLESIVNNAKTDTSGLKASNWTVLALALNVNVVDPEFRSSVSKMSSI